MFAFPHFSYRLYTFYYESYQTLECDSDKKIVMNCICDKIADYCIKYVNGHIQVVTEIIEVTQEAKLITLGETLKLQLRKLASLLSEETEKAEG